MSNTTVVLARLCMPARGRAEAYAAGFVPSAHKAAAAGYTQLISARNDAQGASDAWSPPD
jgi:hypothetical protein